MLSSTDYDKLQQIMQENPENEALINRLLTSHQMEISTISHEIRNPLTLVYSTLQLIESQHPDVSTILKRFKNVNVFLTKSSDVISVASYAIERPYFSV